MAKQSNKLKEWIIKKAIEKMIGVITVTLLGGFFVALFTTPEPTLVTAIKCPVFSNSDLAILNFTIEDYKNLDSVVRINVSSKTLSFSSDGKTFSSYMSGDYSLPPNTGVRFYTDIKIDRSILKPPVQVSFNIHVGCKQKIWYFFDRECRNVIQPIPCN